MVSELRRLASWRTAFIGLGILTLMVLVYVLGPSIAIGGTTPLDGSLTRALAALAIPGALAIGEAIRWQVQSRAQTKMDQALSGVLEQTGRPGRSARLVDDDGAKAGAQEVQTLGLRFKEALTVLKRRRLAVQGGRRWLYQLPWYVVIGPPGSGKTTAIANSGLSFPLADKVGKTAVSGVGGTRNCDWWFTDDAVIIDTAGRYTTQDSNSAQDGAAWLGFLRLLKRYRRRQPLNGILVAIGISDLTAASDEVRAAHAARIRQRIDELYKELGVRLPVYVLFTKADLIAGFSEFFDDLGRDGREAVWGLTFDLQESEPADGYVAGYESEFEALVGRLDERLLERMQKEGDSQKRALIFGFPQQVASLRDLTRQFLREAFLANSFDEPAMLRGVYFVSGTQIGTPLDRVMHAMSRSFGLPAPAPRELAGNKRSYFLTRLIREVILGEQGLVDSDTRRERYLRRLRYAFYVATALVVVGAGYLGISSYLANRALAQRIAIAVDAYETAASKTKLNPVTDAELRPIAPLLDKLSDANHEANSSRGLGMGIPGMDQRGKLGSQTKLAYRHALDGLLLPRLVLHLEDELKTRAGDTDFLYPALKAYLMLGHQGPLDAAFLKDFMQADLAAAYPSSDDAALRQSLGDHVEAMLASPFGTIGLDGDLIAKSRDTLRRVPLARSLLTALVSSPAARALPVWRLDDHLGPAAGVALQRRSGASLSDGIAGIYTRDGFLQVFQPQLPTAAQAALAERWVLDDQATDSDTPEALATLERDTTTLYLQEFGLTWDRVLADVTVKPVKTMDDALRTLNVLSAPTSPIRLLVASAAADTKLDPPEKEEANAKSGAGDGGGGSGGAAAGAAPAGIATGAAAASGATVTGTAEALLSQAVASGDSGAPAKLAQLFNQQGQGKGSSVSDIAADYAGQHFSSLRDLVQVPANSQPGAEPPIDRAIGDLGTLYRSLNQLQGSSSLGADLREAAVSQISSTAASLPPPIKDWILGVSKQSSALSEDDVRRQLSQAWQADPGKLCRSVTENRFPFVKNAAADVPLGDFSRLFGPGGAIDSFVTGKLAPALDTSGKSWRWRSTKGQADSGSAALAQIQRALSIRDVMFAQGGRPFVAFRMNVVSADPGVRQITFELGGQPFVWHPDSGAAMRVSWPIESGSDRAVITIAGKAPASIVEEGPWALFRLLGRGQMRRTNAGDRTLLDFSTPAGRLTLLLQADSIANPLDGVLLGQFRCPQAL